MDANDIREAIVEGLLTRQDVLGVAINEDPSIKKIVVDMQSGESYQIFPDIRIYPNDC